jgi:hypothetical protein
MIQAMLVACVLALVQKDSIQDGEKWLKQAEDKLYRWPSPAVVVHFEADTDVLAPIVAQMKKDLVAKPDAEGVKFVAALAHISMHCAIDTGTGKVTTDIDMPYVPVDPRTQAVVEQIKKRLSLTISGCFQGLPLHDPRFLRDGAKVTGCEESKDTIRVTVEGSQSNQSMCVELARATMLPTKMESSDYTGSYKFREVRPGRFAPERLDLNPRQGQASHAEYTYQEQGGLMFPQRVRVQSGSQVATITFRALKIEPTAH